MNFDRSGGLALDIPGSVIRFAHGVMTAALYDTLLRARLQAWIDRVRSEWELDSASNDGA
jgi:hypothetical protein